MASRILTLGRVRGRGGRAPALIVLVSMLLTPGAGQAALQLGPVSLGYAPAQTLSDPTHLSKGLSSHGFCSGVGGVAFGGVAVTDDGRAIIGLAYRPERPDGERLRVMLEGPAGHWQIVTAPIHDWQLVPIARFASAEQDTCFTLFGHLENPEEERERRGRGEDILNYHPAFVDTLLGLRLFQADVLILRPEACDLPRDDGRYLLGAGERAPDLVANRVALSRVQRQLFGDGGRQPFQSYIICDEGQTVRFSAHGQRLVLTGEPTWYFWKSRVTEAAEMRAIQDGANDRANAVLNQELQRDIDAMGRAAALSKYSPDYRKRRHAEVFDEVISPQILQPLPDLGRTLQATGGGPRGINPAVYDCLVNTMRYAALFRHVRAQHPKIYGAFVKSLAEVEVTPKLQTPTLMASPSTERR